MSFNAFNLHSRVFAGIPATYSTPTPIQTQAIPGILEGKDMLGLAQTGTGKTAAFVLPILHKLLDSKQTRISAVIIAPTRELADQICQTIRQLGAKTGLRATTIYGGVSMHAQIQQLRRGVDIVVACPGRLLDHINKRTIDLRDLKVLVLDEADQMFDMGFLPTIRRVLAALPKNRQTLMFSATMPNELRGLASEALRDPMNVQIGQRAPAQTVAHAIYPVDQDKKQELLFHVFKEMDSGSVLVFTRTKQRAKKLSSALKDAGYSTSCLQGNLSQVKRQEAISGFRTGKYRVLVATDIAARGIDVESVTHVINFDIPATVDAYTHRIGRTGRAERSGDALTFVTREDEGLVRSIERVLGRAIQRKEVSGFTRSAPTTSRSRGRFQRQRGDLGNVNRSVRRNRWDRRAGNADRGGDSISDSRRSYKRYA